MLLNLHINQFELNKSYKLLLYLNNIHFNKIKQLK